MSLFYGKMREILHWSTGFPAIIQAENMHYYLMSQYGVEMPNNPHKEEQKAIDAMWEYIRNHPAKEFSGGKPSLLLWDI